MPVNEKNIRQTEDDKALISPAKAVSGAKKRSRLSGTLLPPLYHFSGHRYASFRLTLFLGRDSCLYVAAMMQAETTAVSRSETGME